MKIIFLVGQNLEWHGCKSWKAKGTKGEILEIIYIYIYRVLVHECKQKHSSIRINSKEHLSFSLFLCPRKIVLGEE
jgi:hypothetical protein